MDGHQKLKVSPKYIITIISFCIVSFIFGYAVCKTTQKVPPNNSKVTQESLPPPVATLPRISPSPTLYPSYSPSTSDDQLFVIGNFNNLDEIGYDQIAVNQPPMIIHKQPELMYEGHNRFRAIIYADIFEDNSIDYDLLDLIARSIVKIDAPKHYEEFSLSFLPYDLHSVGLEDYRSTVENNPNATWEYDSIGRNQRKCKYMRAIISAYSNGIPSEDEADLEKQSEFMCISGVSMGR